MKDSTDVSNVSGAVAGGRGVAALGVIYAAFGAVVAVAPISIYKAYESMSDMEMKCYATAVAEIAVGAAILAAGLVYIFVKRTGARLAAALCVLLLAVVSLLFPTNWTGLCEDLHMPCHMLTMPVLTIAAFSLIALSAAGIIAAVRRGVKVWRR